MRVRIALDDDAAIDPEPVGLEQRVDVDGGHGVGEHQGSSSGGEKPGDGLLGVTERRGWAHEEDGVAVIRDGGLDQEVDAAQPVAVLLQDIGGHRHALVHRRVERRFTVTGERAHGRGAPAL